MRFEHQFKTELPYLHPKLVWVVILVLMLTGAIEAQDSSNSVDILGERTIEELTSDPNFQAGMNFYQEYLNNLETTGELIMPIPRDSDLAFKAGYIMALAQDYYGVDATDGIQSIEIIEVTPGDVGRICSAWSAACFRSFSAGPSQIVIPKDVTQPNQDGKHLAHETGHGGNDYNTGFRDFRISHSTHPEVLSLPFEATFFRDSDLEAVYAVIDDQGIPLELPAGELEEVMAVIFDNLYLYMTAQGQHFSYSQYAPAEFKNASQLIQNLISSGDMFNLWETFNTDPHMFAVIIGRNLPDEYILDVQDELKTDSLYPTSLIAHTVSSLYTQYVGSTQFDSLTEQQRGILNYLKGVTFISAYGTSGEWTIYVSDLAYEPDRNPEFDYMTIYQHSSDKLRTDSGQSYQLQVESNSWNNKIHEYHQLLPVVMENGVRQATLELFTQGVGWDQPIPADERMLLAVELSVILDGITNSETTGSELASNYLYHTFWLDIQSDSEAWTAGSGTTSKHQYLFRFDTNQATPQTIWDAFLLPIVGAPVVAENAFAVELIQPANPNELLLIQNHDLDRAELIHINADTQIVNTVDINHHRRAMAAFWQDVIGYRLAQASGQTYPMSTDKSQLLNGQYEQLVAHVAGLADHRLNVMIYNFKLGELGQDFSLTSAAGTWEKVIADSGVQLDRVAGDSSPIYLSLLKSLGDAHTPNPEADQLLKGFSDRLTTDTVPLPKFLGFWEWLNTYYVINNIPATTPISDPDTIWAISEYFAS